MSIGEIFKTANDRLKSPFLSSFIFSWIAFNWKPIFIAFWSDENVYARIEKIETNYLNIYSNLIFPLSIALAYTILFPYLKVLFDRLTSKAQVDWVTQSNKRELKRLQGSISIANAEFRLEQAKAGTDELKELNDQISKLNEDLETTRSENSTYENQVNILNENLETKISENATFKTQVNKLNKDFKITKSENSTLNYKINDSKKNQIQLEEDLKESRKALDTTLVTFLNAISINKSGDSTVKDLYSIIDNELYSSFKVIISKINSKENTILDIVETSEEMSYFINNGFIHTEPIKSVKEPLVKFQLTEKGVKLKEFINYYETIAGPLF